MRAHAVIGSSFGDEGKGVTVDYICSVIGADLVVRHNSGSQAGHTVTTPEGQRHVFHHYGAGSLLGVATFLSEFYVINPILFAKEDFPDVQVYVDPQAVVTTPMDMLINQAYERKLGRYASCGVGINETMRRSANPRYCLRVEDMLDRVSYDIILEEYVPLRLQELGLDLEIEQHWEKVYFDHAYKFLERIHVTSKPPGDIIVFEGAQGIGLDQRSRNFPFVTHANTGIRNVLKLCTDWGIKQLQTTYVTRSYLTRHGAGPLPDEKPLPKYVKDDTNIMHEFQGPLRYAPLGIQALEMRIVDDAKGMPFDIAVTCMDQHKYDLKKFTLPLKYTSWGPTRTTMEVL